jgi:hypothetical protein
MNEEIPYATYVKNETKESNVFYYINEDFQKKSKLEKLKNFFNQFKK